MLVMAQQIPDAVRAYMSEIGSKTTEAKTRTARANLAKGPEARRKDPMSLPCTCGQCPGNPKTTCPRGRLLRQRARNAQSPSAAPTKWDAWQRAAKKAAPYYEQSLREGGELTALSDAQADIHEYSAEELAAMEAGAFERPLQ